MVSVWYFNIYSFVLNLYWFSVVWHKATIEMNEVFLSCLNFSIVSFVCLFFFACSLLFFFSVFYFIMKWLSPQYMVVTLHVEIYTRNNKHAWLECIRVQDRFFFIPNEKRFFSLWFLFKWLRSHLRWFMTHMA